MSKPDDEDKERHREALELKSSLDELERTEAWLDEHPRFLQDYIVRKATRPMVDAWLISHTFTHSADTSRTSSPPGSGDATPLRKISAQEFEKGQLFLRPMVIKTEDGTPTFISTPVNDSINFVHRKMSREQLASMDEKFIILELVKDICNDLDIKSLCHKILQNISILTSADRASLFVVKGEKTDPGRHFVSTLFDVKSDSKIEQMDKEIKVPWGVGIVGHVAMTKGILNIPDCYQDTRFSPNVDHKTGYKTRSMLCAPILNLSGDVMAVAQVINKQQPQSSTNSPNGNKEEGGEGIVIVPRFTENDEEVFKNFLQFCGIGLRNAQLFERSQLENKRNQVLLDLARVVFEEQSTIEHIVYRIMVHVQSLLECERCQILLINSGKDGSSSPEGSVDSSLTSPSRIFSRVFDLDASDVIGDQMRNEPFEGRFPLNIGITGHVAMTGETLNIPDPYADDRFDPGVDEGAYRNFRHRSILCMPIRNAERQIVGVSQLINKMSDIPFTSNDEDLFEAFAIFCGMGIHNTQIYEEAIKSSAQYRVTVETLSYHASAPLKEAKAVANVIIPSGAALDINSLSFNDFSLDEDQMILATIRMFLDLDLVERFRIDYMVLCRWILSVRRNYRPVTYHNWRHAFNVCQMMFAIITTTGYTRIFGELETLALIIACLCHDLDHRGTNNSFQTKSATPLAQLYSTSTMEHHHFDQCVMILASDGNTILEELSTEEYRKVIRILESAILATDLAVYFGKRDRFRKLIESEGYNWAESSQRGLLRGMLMTACDIAAITKPFETQKVVAHLVASEFFQQGDIEREKLKVQPIDMMNREKEDQLPKMQVSFIDTICIPVYKAFAKLSPELEPLHEGVKSNRECWLRMVFEEEEMSKRNHLEKC